MLTPDETTDKCLVNSQSVSILSSCLALVVLLKGSILMVVAMGIEVVWLNNADKRIM